MQRRDFLRWAAVGGVSSVAGCTSLPWPSPAVSVLRPGMEMGHWLRDGVPAPDPAQTRRCDTVILGSGAAGLFAGWRLAQQGYRDFLMLNGAELHGNAAGGQFGALSYPRGAHYLPLPSMESTHVRDLLFAIGVLQRDPYDARPVYDETVLVHAPEERLLVNGVWQEGLTPAVSDAAREQFARFFKQMAQMRNAVGADGRRAFVIPLALSSTDPVFLALEKQTFSEWLTKYGYTDEAMLWYANYCCRDDYGFGIDRVSAWAGIHYFASRGGHAANAEDGAVLTWPEGLNAVAKYLAQQIGANRLLGGMALKVRERSKGVEVVCFDPQRKAAFAVEARRAIVAMPLHVAVHVVEGIESMGFDRARDLPQTAPWMVSNFLLDGFPPEPTPGKDVVPQAWDNVVYQGKGLGWVVSTHQWIRQARPEQTVFTAYHAFADMTAQAARQWMLTASQDDMLKLAASDLHDTYGHRLWQHTRQVEITLRGHAMPSPTPGFLSRPGVQTLRKLDGPILFAHADLSGLSVFEEAAWWGEVAARSVLVA